MRGRFALALALVILMLTPTGVSPPSGSSPEPNGGLERACSVATSPRPCDHLRVVTDTQIEPGETDTYNGTWTVDSTIHVMSGGTLVLDAATFRFTASSGGILVDAGGALRIVASTLEPRGNDSTAYVLDLAPGSSFTLNTSTVRAGHGVKLRTSDAEVSGNLLTQIPLALHMIDVVEVTIHHNRFLDNEVAVNQTGGITRLEENRFEGGATCVRDWLADPTIVGNVFRGCHVGIWHERSNSRFALNDMEDEMNPPGTGIVVMDTNSPVIEDNLIRRYGTGILVVNATAYIRNNTIADNVDDGVRIVANSQPMDIQGNLIAGNGGDGIHLLGATDVAISNNTVQGNGGSGIRVERSPNTSLVGDLATGNAAHGVQLLGLADATLIRVNASANGADGFHVDTAPESVVDLFEAIAIGNAGAGLRGTQGTTADQGWWEDNGGAGVENVGEDWVLSSVCSYWGDPSGPTHEDNPDGQGDEASDNVLFTPYRSAPASTSCSPIFVDGDGYLS